MTGSGEVGGGGGDGSTGAPGPVFAGHRPEPADRRAEWFWSRGFPVLTVALALAVPALLVTGRSVVLHSTEGAVERQVTDPSAPGWHAFTEPTPVALVVHRSAAGALVAITLVSLIGEGHGAVVFVPVDTVVPGDADRTLAAVAAEGEPALRTAVESLLGLAPSDLVSLDASAWREAVGPAAPLTVENPDAVFAEDAAGNRTLRFPRGPLQLAAADVPDYLALRNDDERDLNRLVRHEVFWRAWLEAAGRAPAAAAPGGAVEALARYTDALAGGRVDLSTLPVQAVDGGGAPGAERYRPVPAQLRAALGRVVPFPVGGPVPRLRIRLIDGVGTLHHGLDAAAGLVARGGQIDRVGNALSFGVRETRLEYADEARRREVEALAQELGVGEAVKVPSIETGTDVVVILGQDYVDARAAGRGGSGG